MVPFLEYRIAIQERPTYWRKVIPDSNQPLTYVRLCINAAGYDHVQIQQYHLFVAFALYVNKYTLSLIFLY